MEIDIDIVPDDDFDLVNPTGTSFPDLDDIPLDLPKVCETTNVPIETMKREVRVA